MEQRVHIAPGCTRCGWCHALSPEIFALGEQGMLVRGESRCDRKTSTNCAELSPLTPDALATVTPLFLQFIADGCPAKVIALDPASTVDILS